MMMMTEDGNCGHLMMMMMMMMMSRGGRSGLWHAEKGVVLMLFHVRRRTMVLHNTGPFGEG